MNINGQSKCSQVKCNINMCVAFSLSFDQEELVQIVGIAKKNIVNNMNKLQENGIIKCIGADKNGRWEIENP